MTKISLPAKLDRGACSEMLPVLASAVASGETIEIDAAAVERVGQCGLQLLVSVATSAERRGGCVTISSPSVAFMETAQRAALADWLEERV